MRLDFRGPAALFLSIATVLFTTSSWAQTTLNVGVRKDAPPFSYLKVTNGEMTYGGYVVQVCNEVLKAMKETHTFDVEFHSQKPSERFSDLRSRKIDILCDPATINRERLEFENVMVSQPIYFSGVGLATATRYKQVAPHWPCVGPIVGLVKGTTTSSKLINRLAEDTRFGLSFGQKILQHPIVDEVALSEQESAQFGRCGEVADQFGIDQDRLIEATDPMPVVKSYPSHSDLAEAVCMQEVMFSVGDLEIIAKALDDQSKKNPDCKYRVDPEVISAERYGIFVHVSDQLDEVDKLVLAFLRQLSIEIHKGKDSVLIRSFRDNFVEAKVSRSLDQFYWNVISGGG